MFSPYYAWARRFGPADPMDHCALNVVLYGDDKRWTLTERRRSSIERSPTHFRIGPSALSWEGDTLVVRINEVTAPVPSPVRGVVRLHPIAIENRVLTLDAAGRHRWSPIAPCARAEVELETPALRWSGPAYFDTNDGDAPLEADFARWDWSRAAVPHGTSVLYEVTRRDGTALSLSMAYDAKGGVEDFEPPPHAELPRTRWWRMVRGTRADAGHPVTVVKTLEDTPFYSRSVLSTRLRGQNLTAMHESLCLNRFRSLGIQWMLPFRVPRERR